MYERWASYTNMKADIESKKKKDNCRYWYKTGPAEIKAWVASVLWWCLLKNMSFENIWKHSVDPGRIKRWFTENRWLQMKLFLKVSDPLFDEERKSDKMCRVCELWEHFISRCKANYWPSQQIGLDEAIKKFKGRCSFKQYIKNKPVRWGIKVFAVCCSKTGYLWNAAFYLGKTTEDASSTQKEASATQRAVLEILSPLSNKNHIVHMDNYYTSIPLLNELFVRTEKDSIHKCASKRVKNLLSKSNRGSFGGAHMVHCAWWPGLQNAQSIFSQIVICQFVMGRKAQLCIGFQEMEKKCKRKLGALQP
jgi:hypothetical protein